MDDELVHPAFKAGDDDGPRYWGQDIDLRNIRDMLGSVSRGEVVALCDEEAGGIIGYILAPFEDQVVRELNAP